MKLTFVDESWDDYLHWQKTDKKMGSIGNRSHETTNAIQYYQGLISFAPLGTNKLSYDKISPVDSEVKAYRTQFAISHGKVPSDDKGITPNNIFKVNGDYLWYLIVNGVYIYRPDQYH